MRPEPDQPERQSANVPRTLPAELLKLTYQNRLRAIGRQLDISNARTVLILEVDGGFIVRAVDRNDRDVDLLEFTDDSYPERMIEATESRGSGERQESPSPVAPTGYEDLLRAIGRALDERGAIRIVLVEKARSIVVTGNVEEPGGPEPFDAEFGEAEIVALLDESFRLRRDEE